MAVRFYGKEETQVQFLAAAPFVHNHASMPGMRKLVSIREIAAVSPIEGADAIEAIKVDGWTVVAQKNQGHAVGNEIVYFEIDSFLPFSDERFAFLEPRGSKVMDGVSGHVLKTIKLRGTYSQGLILPLDLFPELDGTASNEDVSDLIGVKKWEPPMPAELAGKVVGRFPGWLARTDAERVQNLGEFFPLRGVWLPTEKIDGTSATYALSPDGEFVVCSRNLQLEPGTNTYWKMADTLQIEQFLRSIWSPGTTVSLQGEIYGEGIQGNRLGVKGVRFAAFDCRVGDVYNSANLAVFTPSVLNDAGIETVGMYTLDMPSTVEAAVEQVDGIQSIVQPGRLAEGVVWWPSDAGELRNFKAISNKWLSKEK